MTRKALIGARILTQSGWRTDHALLIDRPTIVDVVSDSRVPTGFDPVRLGGGMLVPGFIDTQVNGGGAVLFNESPTIAAVVTHPQVLHRPQIVDVPHTIAGSVPFQAPAFKMWGTPTEIRRGSPGLGEHSGDVI